MTTKLLKAKLTKAIAEINDKSFLEALYTIIHKAEHSCFEYELSEADLAIIESRRKSYLSGKSKTISPNEMRKRFSKKFGS